MISRGFSSRFLKCSFHSWCLFSWLSAFCFIPAMLFLLFNSFTVCHASRDYLPSTEFLILLIWPGIYSSCSSWYVLVSSLWTFLSFSTLVFVWFLLLSEDTLFMLPRFSLTVIDSQGTLQLTFGLVGACS